MQVYTDYNEAVKADPHNGAKLYLVNWDQGMVTRDVWVWAKSNKDALVFAAKHVGMVAYINRPGVTLDEEVV